jgi:hypothetical protein
MALLEPLEISVKTLKGDQRTYTISKFPAIAGREIIAKYPLSAVPKLSDYAHNEEVMGKLMTYVAISIPGANSALPPTLVPLSTKALIDSHVPDWETLVKIELEMMKYNTSFFTNGEISTFLGDTARKWIASISPTWTASLQQLLVAAKQRLENLKKPTR